MKKRCDVTKDFILQTVYAHRIDYDLQYYNRMDMKKIAQYCNIAVGTLYKYYPSKDDLANDFYLLLLKNDIEKLKDLHQKYSYVQMIICIWASIIQNTSTNYTDFLSHLYLMDSFTRYPTYLNLIIENVRQLLGQAIHQNELKKNIDLSKMSHLIAWNIVINCFHDNNYFMHFIFSLDLFNTMH